eukprot:Nk52_evm2s759 gene=Nk52_evmTU2s759
MADVNTSTGVVVLAMLRILQTNMQNMQNNLQNSMQGLQNEMQEFRSWRSASETRMDQITVNLEQVQETIGQSTPIGNGSPNVSRVGVAPAASRAQQGPSPVNALAITVVEKCIESLQHLKAP